MIDPSVTSATLGLGYVIALFGSPFILLAARRANLDSLSVGVRASLWVLAGIDLWLASRAYSNWPTLFGLTSHAANAPVRALVIAAGLMAAGAASGVFLRALGGHETLQNAQFQKLAEQPVGRRVFIVLTAGVTEEILYRGYAVGVGAEWLGSREWAIALSLLAFVAAHFRWGWGHLVPVLLAAITLTSAFIITGDLLACMMAHVLVDAFGILAAPALLKLKHQRDALAKDRNPSSPG